MATYLAYLCGKMNQSLALTTETYNHLFEINMVKFKLLSAVDYDFVNLQTGEKTTHKIGKTVTTNREVGGFSATTNSYFKIDKVNCFEVLEKKGYSFSFDPKLDIFHPEFDLLDKNNNPVAHFKTNVTGERQENVGGIGNKQKNIVVTTDLDDLEVIALAAFILYRVDFSINLV